MQLRRSLEEAPPARRSLAVGSFDGVHLGHRRVIEAAVDGATRSGITTAVVTFHPRPVAVLRPELATHELSTIERRAELVGELGADELIVIPFTRELSRVDADGFAAEVLHGGLGAEHVAVGENFRYGHRAQGTVATLRNSGERLGFTVTAVPLLELHSGPVSSSRIRDLIGAGDVETARELLGRPPWLEGTVVRGDGRGRGLGFATANLAQPAGSVVPGRGIYAGRAHVAATERPAAISIGFNPTFTDARDAVRVEAHLLDFGRDIYGEWLRIELVHRLRDEERFGSVDDLVAQLHRDVARTRELMAHAGTQ